MNFPETPSPILPARTFVARDESAWESVASVLTQEFIQAPAWVHLKGDLGAGKTSLVRALLRSWGWQEAVPSPTYSILNEYDLGDRRVVHIDAFRLEPGGELPFDPLEWDAQSIVLIEWPQKLLPFLTSSLASALLKKGYRFFEAQLEDEKPAGRKLHFRQMPSFLR